MTTILGDTKVTLDVAINWAQKRGAHDRFIQVAQLYWRIAPRYNIPAELAYVQSAKETNYGKYTGIVIPEYHNWCGLKTENAIGDTLEDHAKFDNDELGVLAHVQHLAKYGGQFVPVDNDPLIDPRSKYVFIGAAIEIKDLGGKWAPSLTYGIEIETLLNDIRETQQSGTKYRFIVMAGHENIRNITEEKIGIESANNLRNSTGALGREAEWTTKWADRLVALLNQSGVSAIRTDARYNVAYAQPATLVIAGHWDGVDNANHKQWCMASAVIAGASTSAIDSLAENFVKTWYSIYPKESGIAGNGPITPGMIYYYGGWYRTADTPMVIIEHGIMGAGNVLRTDLPTPEDTANIDFECIVKHYAIPYGPIVTPNDQSRFFEQTGCLVGGGFYQYWKKHNGLQYFGLPKTNEIQENGLTVQYFERARFEHVPGIDPDDWDVQLGLLGNEVIALRQRIAELETK